MKGKKDFWGHEHFFDSCLRSDLFRFIFHFGWKTMNI